MHKAKPKTEFPNEAIIGAKYKNTNDFSGSRDVVIAMHKDARALLAKAALEAVKKYGRR